MQSILNQSTKTVPNVYQQDEATRLRTALNAIATDPRTPFWLYAQAMRALWPSKATQ